MAQLNDKQREFARLLAGGMSKADAYRKAFSRSDMTDAAAYKAGGRLSKKAEVVEFLDSLRHQSDIKAVIDRQRRMEMLSRTAQDCHEAGDVKNMVRCITELNKMDGAYEPEVTKVEVNGGFAALMDVVARGVPPPEI